MSKLVKSFDVDMFFENVSNILEPEGLNIEILDEVSGGASLVLPWTITNEYLEHHGHSLGTAISKMMGIQAGEDLKELLLKGDTDSKDPLLKALDGFNKRQLDVSNNAVNLAFDSITSSKRDGEMYYELKILVNIEV